MPVSIVGGEKLKAKLAEMAKNLGPGKTLQVGFLECATCGKDNTVSAPSVAFFNEYGTVERAQLDLDSINTDSKTGPMQKGQRRAAAYRHIPARPFFRNMIAKYHKSWGKLLQATIKQQGYSIMGAFSLTGEVMVSQLQKSIEDFTDPGNAESTKKAKGFDKPLEDSKNMKRAVAYAITGLGNGGEKNA